MDSKNLITRYNQVFFPNYAPLFVIPDKADKAQITDVMGEQYIDFTGGIAVNALGHRHHVLLDSLIKQADKLWHTSNFFMNQPAIELAEYITQNSFADKVFFGNSGTEANEAAIKLARKYAISKISQEKYEIISFKNAFHGRSMMMVAIGGQEKYKSGFGPLPAGIHIARFNDIDSVKALVNKNTAAIIIEPIQGEGGVREAKQSFLSELRAICDQHQALLIFDEIQCGMGRIGHLFAYEYFKVIPDILTTAKALGAGLPISATLTKANIAEVFTVGTHGSTYGGNPLVTKVASENIKLINDKKLLEGVKTKSAILKERISQFNRQHQIFKDIRGLGLLIGLEFADEYQNQAALFMQLAIQEKLLLLVAGSNVVRLAPSLIIENETINAGLHALDKVMKQFKDKKRNQCEQSQSNLKK